MVRVRITLAEVPLTGKGEYKLDSEETLSRAEQN